MTSPAFTVSAFCAFTFRPVALAMSTMDAEPSTQLTQGAPEAGGDPPKCLMIRQLELTNFKSYANVVKIGPFDRHMTSVVGPNGSGKSNVIDAMLFVFGFKAKQCAPPPARALPPSLPPPREPPAAQHAPCKRNKSGAADRTCPARAGCGRARCRS